MFIKKIAFKNYKGLRDVSFELDRHMNVFCGDNGSGKSSIVEIIPHLLAALRPPQQKSTVDFLQIKTNDISKGEDESVVTLTLESENNLQIIASSNSDKQDTPNEQLPQKFSLNAMFFSSTRGGRFAQTPLNDELLSTLARLDSRLIDSLLDESIFSNAIEWLKRHENAENENFRNAYDNGNLDEFQPDSMLRQAKLFIDEMTGYQVQFNNLQDTLLAKKEDAAGRLLELPFEQLSQGEKIFIGLSAGITIFTYELEFLKEMFPEIRPIVIIDEIDLHLHPNWQRKVIPALSKAFPECQFIITTHSPQVLGEVKPKNIFILSQGKNGVEWHRPSRSYGLRSSEVVEDIMQGSPYSSELYENIQEINQSIQDGNFAKAHELLEKCEEEYDNVPILVETRTLLEFEEWDGADD